MAVGQCSWCRCAVAGYSQLCGSCCEERAKFNAQRYRWNLPGLAKQEDEAIYPDSPMQNEILSYAGHCGRVVRKSLDTPDADPDAFARADLDP